uniref:Hydrolase, alpha/beta fold family functionally coupled to Phosphoribulokinase n=1 Tax=uncultured Thiotrichaceae bacterium TaxID=298394 RepID=A0A6S6U802_9GAMM|nr:MAG: Hydrolase, alpha/beta fold family functionally coupled to Phosphoribulokinase [uncultured Thiotrichaceae bacterium]
MGKIINSSFQPSWWLRSPHFQTIWPSLFRKQADFTPEWERVELDDGDFMDLAWHRRQEADAPIVLIIHGLEGSLESHYANTMLAALHKAGFSSAVLHLRGRGREPNRLPQSYHSGATDDLRLILNHLEQQQQIPKAVIGVSLGGNLLLKYLGEEGGNCPLTTAIAVSVPFQLRACSQRLGKGFAKIYGQYLLRKLHESYHKKFSKVTSPLTIDLKNIKTLWQFDDAITAPLHGFKDAKDYYQQCSSAQFLPKITTPTLIIHSQDDPFMTPEIVPTEKHMSEQVTLELTQHGGHVGFIEGYSDGALKYWLEQRVVSHLQEQLT